MVLLPSLAVAHGSFHELMAQWEKDHALHPDDPALMVQRASVELEHDDWQATLASLEKASRLGAFEGDLALMRGRALAQGKLWPMAKSAFDDFLAAHPAASSALTERARVLMKLGQNEAALNDYRAALKTAAKPEPELVIEVAGVMTAKEAISVLDAGIAALGPVPSLVTKALDLEVAARRFDAAVHRLDGMVTQARPEPWMARQASVLAQAGRLRESTMAWQQLRAHVLALPADERSSHAMSQCLEQANTALASLASVTMSEGGARQP